MSFSKSRYLGQGSNFWTSSKDASQETWRLGTCAFSIFKHGIISSYLIWEDSCLWSKDYGETFCSQQGPSYIGYRCPDSGLRTGLLGPVHCYGVPGRDSPVGSPSQGARNGEPRLRSPKTDPSGDRPPSKTGPLLWHTLGSALVWPTPKTDP